MAPTPDPDFLAVVNAVTGGAGTFPPMPVHDVLAFRAQSEDFITQIVEQSPDPPADLETRDYHVRTADGHSLLLRWYTRPDVPPNSPALLWIHGGGLIACSISHFHKNVAAMVSATSTPVLLVEYRLAPEHPYPTPVEDCYTALKWLYENADTLKINKNLIALYGESAGGNLAAGTTLLAHSRAGPGVPRARKQILIYPMLDDRNIDESRSRDDATFNIWTHVNNALGWTSYLGSRRGSSDVPEFAAPSRLKDATGLPDLYLEVGELDILRDEGIEYVLKHLKAGVSTEFHLRQGVPHGFEFAGATTPMVAAAIADRIRVIKGLGKLKELS